MHLRDVPLNLTPHCSTVQQVTVGGTNLARLAINSLTGMISVVIGLYCTISLLAYVLREYIIHYAWLLM
jgi:hypothetical protein